MKIEEKSFLSDVFGGIFFSKSTAKWIFYGGTCALLILVPLTILCYNSVVSWFFDFFSGTSLIFIVYIWAIIGLLDRKVAVEYIEGVREVYKGESSYREEYAKRKMSIKYLLTIFWGCFLLFLAGFAIYATNRYRHDYAFACSDIYVEEERKIYHLYDKCCDNNKRHLLVRQKGYQIKNLNFNLCTNCKDLKEEYDEIEAERHTAP